MPLSNALVQAQKNISLKPSAFSGVLQLTFTLNYFSFEADVVADVWSAAWSLLEYVLLMHLHIFFFTTTDLPKYTVLLERGGATER